MTEYLSTGEASELLNVSRSTISRKFDLGVLRGKTNPVTGERLISRESILAFAKQYNLAAENLPSQIKTILLGSVDRAFVTLVQSAFAGDERLRFQMSGRGADTLVACSKATHDLLLLDEEISDIPFEDVVRALRRSEYTRKKSILICYTRTSRDACLACGADEALPKDLLESGTLSTALYGLLKLEREPQTARQTFEHNRQWPRIRVSLPATIYVYPVSAPRRRQRGEAVVENISRGGLLISQLKLTDASLPLEPFRVLIEIDQPPLEKFRAHCQMVRLQSIGILSAGLQFVRISKANLQKIVVLQRA